MAIKAQTFSNKFEADGIVFEEPGAQPYFLLITLIRRLPTCERFSQILGIDADLIIPDKQLSVYEGAVAFMERKTWLVERTICKRGKKLGFPVHKPIIDLNNEQLNDLWNGEMVFMVFMIF